MGGTNQLLQCGECGHWSGEAAPATSLVTAAAGGNQFRDVSHDTWRGLGPRPRTQDMHTPRSGVLTLRPAVGSSAALTRPQHFSFPVLQLIIPHSNVAPYSKLLYSSEINNYSIIEIFLS